MTLPSLKNWNIAMIRIREIYRYVKTFTCIGIPKHWWLSWFRLETFITFLTFRFSTQGERDTIFTMLTVPSNPANAGASRSTKLTGLAQVQKSTRFVQPQISTNSFFQNTQESQPIASGHDIIHIPSPIFYPGFLWWHLWLSHPPRANVNTCAQCEYLTNPCTKPKSSKLNKTER